MKNKEKEMLLNAYNLPMRVKSFEYRIDFDSNSISIKYSEN